MNLPEKFIQTVLGVHKEIGEQWLNSFDHLIQYCEQNWSLQVGAPYSLSFNFAAPVLFNDGREAVLKLCVPGKEFHTELEALRLYGGNGIAKLIDADQERGVMILERLQPGHTLNTVENDEEATVIAASLMKKLHIPVPASHYEIFPTTAKWAEGLERLREHFNGGTGPFPVRMVQKAEQLFAKLNRAVKNPVLLHGDLHHENILSAEREPWIAIDPKGLIGEAEYGVIQFLLNNLPDDHVAEVTERRIDIFVEELKLDKARVLSWAFCHSILSAWWCIEDGSEWSDDSLRMPMIFEELLKKVT